MAKYDETFWRRVTATLQPVSIAGTLLRMVENQEQVVTNRLVDSLEEQALLETLLEYSKPKGAWDLSSITDYLLKTPWRYPPLDWGSRFGRRFEPGIFYGTASHTSLFCESAYYRWVFIDAMASPFNEPVVSQHTVFEARYATNAGLQLEQQPFLRHKSVLTDKSSYQATQALGTVLREREIKAFSYISARAPTEASCIALLHPDALKSRRHQNPTLWLCQTSTDLIEFKHQKQLAQLRRGDFEVEGKIPAPA